MKTRSKAKNKKKIHWVWKSLFGSTVLFAFGLRFIICPRSEENWMFYFLGHEGFLYLLPFCLLMAILSLKHWRLTLGWISLFALNVVMFGSPTLGSRPETVPPKTLKVLTYNVAHFALNRPAVEAILKESNADIIFIQEVSQMSMLSTAGDDLRIKMPGYNWVGASTNLILSKHPMKLERIVDVPTKWPKKQFPVAVIETPIGKVKAMCVHMEPSWVMGGTFDAASFRPVLEKVGQDRRAQVDLIFAATKPSKIPVIMAGDFNGQSYSESVSRISKAFTDCYAATEKGFGMSLLASLPYKRIDYVFCRELTPISSEVIESRASDHKPLISILAPRS